MEGSTFTFGSVPIEFRQIVDVEALSLGYIFQKYFRDQLPSRQNIDMMCRLVSSDNDINIVDFC